jgi:hypothetical protein
MSAAHQNVNGNSLDDAVQTDVVLPATRVLAAVIVPILFVAFVMLYLFPDKSG